ncbi:tetratricopeptide repeat protein [Xanthocytophaga flava]|uniref:tetratricopeptide repeat protein n=1 Tax=Xanthocytophaga flava TaxID=3048013 RepID=UPI0028D09445|nr:tetratricopeptide repeat protein [Xanthocytophaga flavus]MDJ1470631.1 tetratricopeptide repeat protein [Xanthocytophaga flavus]
MSSHSFRIVALVVFFSYLCSPAFAQKNRRHKDETHRQSELAQAEYYFTEGMKYYLLDNYTKAVDYFQKSLEINAENAGTNYAIAQALAKTRSFQDAIPYAEKAIKLVSTNKYYYILLADLYTRDKKYPQAAKAYQELVRIEPNDPESYIELANLYLQQGKYDDAIKAYDQIEKRIGITEEISRQKQQIFLKTNHLNDAISEGKKLVESFPDEPRYALLLAEIYTANKRTNEAIPLLEKVASGSEASSQAHLILSDIYRQQGKVQEADQEIEKAFGNSDLEASVKVQILANYIQTHRDQESRKKALKFADLIIKAHPMEAKAYAVYGDLLAMNDQKENARLIYSKASRLDNSIYEVWSNLLRLDAELNQVDSLIKHSEQALELFPNQGEFWFFNGYAYLLRKNYQKAVDALEEGKKLASSDQKLLNDYNSMLGDAYNGNGEYTRSDAAYEEVLANDPDNSSVLNNYSYYLSLRKQKLEKAKEMSKRLMDKHPDNASYIDTHAWVLYMLKEYKESKKYLELAIKDGNNGTILEHYGDVLYKLGETEKAVEIWMKAKKAGETTETIDKKIAQRKLVE